MCTVCFISRYKEAVSYKITDERQAFFTYPVILFMSFDKAEKQC